MVIPSDPKDHHKGEIRMGLGHFTWESCLGAFPFWISLVFFLLHIYAKVYQGDNNSFSQQMWDTHNQGRTIFNLFF